MNLKQERKLKTSNFLAVCYVNEKFQKTKICFLRKREREKSAGNGLNWTKPITLFLYSNLHVYLRITNPYIPFALEKFQNTSTVHWHWDTSEKLYKALIYDKNN